MRKVRVNIEQDSDGEWWAQSPEAVGFFAYGESRQEALANAKEALALFLDVDEDSIELLVTEMGTAEDGEDQ